MEIFSCVPCKQRLPTWTHGRYSLVEKRPVALTGEPKRAGGVGGVKVLPPHGNLLANSPTGGAYAHHVTKSKSVVFTGGPRYNNSSMHL